MGLKEKITSFISKRKLLSILLAVLILEAVFAAVFIYKFGFQNFIKKAANEAQQNINGFPQIQNQADSQGTGQGSGSSAKKNSNSKKSGSSSSSGSSGQAGSSSSSGSPTVVAFYADSQSDTDADDQNHQRVVNYILSTGANPVFHAGDLLEDGTQDSLNRFNNVTATLRATRSFYAAAGNNERNAQIYFDNFSFPGNEHYYAVNVGNLHMIILDSAYYASDPGQLSFLASDLQSAASQSKITGVMFHYPTYFSTILSSLTNYGADFAISGHNHSYAKSTTNGITHLTCSGQESIGYFLAYIYSDRAVIKVYNSNNSLIDTASFNAR